MNSFLGNAITNNMHSEVTAMILCSNLSVFQIKYLNTAIPCPREWKTIWEMESWESKQSDYLPHPW